MTSNGSYIRELLTDLAACLCAEIDSSGPGGLCFCGVLPGASIAEDFLPSCMEEEDANGMAWVRLANSYPAFQPGIVVENPAESAMAGLGADIEIGILRSIPLDAEGITEAEAATAVTQQMDDMLAIRRAVVCCASLDRADYLLAQYLPVGPLGGMVGGAFTVMVHKP